MFYLCELHNVVNKMLNKPTFDCFTLEEHWGGDCGCDLNKENAGTDIDANDDNNAVDPNNN
jgi:hypothetical protein